MMNIRVAKIFTVFALGTLLLSAFAYNPVPAMARSLDEIESEISEREGELSTIQSQLDELEGSLAEQEGALDGVSGELPRIAAQIETIEATLAYNELQMRDLELQLQINQLQYEEAEVRQQSLVEQSYLSWKTGVETPYSILDSTKNYTYQSLVISDGYGSLLDMVNYINSLQNNISDFEESSAQLVMDNEELIALKEQLLQEQSQIVARIDTLSGQVSGVQTRQGQVSAQLDNLYAEQQAILEYEQEILEGGDGDQGGGANDEPDPPEDPADPPSTSIYMGGQGRDLYQGHGVGMSQFGALGAALQGWGYKQILQFYYSGSDVQVYQPDRQINVDGYGAMHIDTYVAGAAEVPSVACEDVGLAFDPGNIWRCWPREAIKAQAVAFRTYGIYQTQDGSAICTTTSCQVYNGSENMQWAATETAGEVIVHGGDPINAVYSSDNNQGGGTANNDTVWSNYSGDGWGLPYLSSVNDNAFAYRTQWTDFHWQTNRYYYTQMDQLLDYVNYDSGLSYARSFVNGIRSDIGAITSMSLEKDPSGRVRKVVFSGAGGTRVMAGWLFKSIWNAWVYNVQPSGGRDYIYSLTFTISQ